MNNNKKYIRGYLQNYISELKNNGISEKYNEIKTRYKNISRYVNNYTIEHPAYTNVILGDYQSGGTLMSEEFVDKMNKISAIFNEYKHTDMSSITHKTK